MQIEGTLRETRIPVRFVITPYGEFPFEEMLAWLVALLLSPPEKPTATYSNPGFVKLIQNEGLATKDRKTKCFYYADKSKCDDVIMAIRRACMFSRGQAKDTTDGANRTH